MQPAALHRGLPAGRGGARALRRLGRSGRAYTLSSLTLREPSSACFVFSSYR
jgi:hypothetical protein